MVDTYYIDGDYVAEDDARLSVKDITILRGYGVFDFLITYNRRPFHLKAHVARLENSARNIGLALAHTQDQICEIVHETIARNPHHSEANLRIVYTGGISPDSVTPQGNGVLMVMATPKLELPDWWYRDGASVAVVDIERFIPTSKSTDYLNAVFAQRKAKAKGAIEAVYMDRKGRVLEGTTTNIFGFLEGELLTPPDGILPGITRQVVMDLAKTEFQVQERHFDLKTLLEMDEVFLTASNKEIVPIIRVDETMIANGCPGERTLRIMDLFRNYTDAYGRGEIAD